MNEKIEKVTLKLGFHDGFNGEEVKLKNKTINKINTQTPSDSLVTVAQAIGSLYKKELLKVVKVEEKVLQ